MMKDFQVSLLVCVFWSWRRTSGRREADVSSLCSPQWPFKSFFSLRQHFTEDDKRTKKRHIVFFYILYFARRLYTGAGGCDFSVKPFYPPCCWQWGGQTSAAQIWWSHYSTETSVVSSGCQINRETALMRLYDFYWGNKITGLKTDSDDLCFKISRVCILMCSWSLCHKLQQYKQSETVRVSQEQITDTCVSNESK